MDFDAAIKAHSEWKLKIVGAAKSGNREKLDPAIVGKDNVCALGQWLYGDGKRAMSAQGTQYQELVKLHAQFHREAASLITAIIQGQAVAVEAGIQDRNSPFNQISLKVVGMLMKLRAAQA